MRMTNCEEIKRFLLGGKAHFTLTSKKTGVIIWYRVVTKDDGVVFVNETDMNGRTEYLGMTWTDTLRSLWPTAKSPKAFSNLDSVIAFNYLLQVLRSGREELPPSLIFEHVGICSVCGRELTDPTSVALGIGPVCRGDRG